MMNSGPHFFGLGNGRVSDAEYKRVLKIAEKHGADFTRVTLPGEGPRYWFECPNRGEPFDSRTARAVMAEVGAVKTKAR